MSGGRFNFPRWNYGYTLGPPSASAGGNYTQFHMPMYGGPYPGAPHMMGYRGGYPHGGPRGGGPSSRGKPPIKKEKPTPASSSAGGDASASASTSEDTPTIKQEPTETAAAAPIKQEPQSQSASETQPPPAEDGEIVETSERPLTEILCGRNPIMFCNDQSKLRSLHMEWEQVSEIGPPHEKIFTWSLKMGEMTCLGTANSKKGAKNKAAEEMAKRLDTLPMVGMKRNYFNAFGGGGPMPMRGGRGRGRGGRGGGGFYANYGAMPPPNYYGNHRGRGRGGNNSKRPKKDDDKKPDAVADDQPLHPAQNNPISKIYEYTKKRKLPEPIFETIQEEVLETRKTTQGFTFKKTKFTIQCEILGKKYLGESMSKKTAKFNAAAAAWAEIGAGVGQASIDNLLQSSRDSSATSTASGSS